MPADRDPGHAIFSPETGPDAFCTSSCIADAQGRVSNLENTCFTVLRFGAGALQVNLAWDTETDVDLYVTDPNGEESSYSIRTARAAAPSIATTPTASAPRTSSGARDDALARAEARVEAERKAEAALQAEIEAPLPGDGLAGAGVEGSSAPVAIPLRVRSSE